jgi:hypothetical protein
MKEERKNREKWLHVRLTEHEFALITEQFSAATDQKLSDFARRKLLGKPVRVLTRNQSFDEATEQLARLRAELSRLAANYNQAVKKLNSLARIKDYEQWLLTYELDRRKLLTQVDKIAQLITQIAEKWSL